MQRMKLFALSVIMAAALFSCGDDYDDTALKKEIDDLKTRVEKLEDWCDTANGQISALQGLVSAMEQNDYITGVTPVVEGTKETGYIITFAKSDPITIRHGKNGTDGTDGDAGITPIIGAKQDTDGNYYWTIKTGDEDPVWMTDAEGNKIRTTGDDAVAVKPVISVDTDTDGKLYWKIDGVWLLDKENKKVPATGEKGDKGDKGDTGATGGSGSQGAAGEQGPQGDAVFKKDGVKLDDAGCVTFTLADGITTFTVPRSVAISIGTDGIFYYTDATKVVPITLPTNFTKDDYASIMAEVKSSYGTSVDIKTRDAGGANPQWKVEVTPPTFDGEGKYEKNSAQVTLTASGNMADNPNAWLEVTILDAKGKKSTAACAIKVTDGVPVTTPDALSSAFGAESGTADTPAKITLGADITAASAVTEIVGFKELDGNSNTLTNGQFTISSDNDASPSALTMNNTTLVSPQLSVNNNGALTLGEGVSITSASTASNPFSVTGSGAITVDGATFTQTAQTEGFSWINVAPSTAPRSVVRSRSTSAPATLILKKFTFTNSNDYISISGAATIQMVPGDNKSLNLYLNEIKTEDLTITPSNNTFSQSDVERLSIRTGSTIDGKDGDGYELYLDNGVIKLRAKSTGGGVTAATAAELIAAATAATGTPDAPVRITLAADINMPAFTDGEATSKIHIDLAAGQHVWIDGAGHRLTRGSSNRIFSVRDGASLQLTNLTMDGENNQREKFITVGGNSQVSGQTPGTLTLGGGFKLTGARNALSFMMNGISVSGILVIEPGAEITGNGTGHPLALTPTATLHLKGGSFSQNSGDDLSLQCDAGKAPTATIDAALPADFACKLDLTGYVNQDGTVACETVISGTDSYTLTESDLARFTLNSIWDTNSTHDVSGYALVLDGNAIKLRQQAPASITADAVKTALTGTGTDAIVIDGNLTLSTDEQITMGADHTLTISPGATLTIDKKGITGFSGGTRRTLTINGGGTLLTRNTEDGTIFQSGNLKLAGITVRMEGGYIYNANIEVGSGAAILLNCASQVTHLNIVADKTITVNTGGRIEINSFVDQGIACAGTLLIDGGTVSINGAGTVSTDRQNEGRSAYAVDMSSNTSKLQISNNGKLVSTVADGTVFLMGKQKEPMVLAGCKVQGVNGLFRAGDFTLNTDEETEVGLYDATDALRHGLYKWDGSSMFVWASRQ